MTDILGQAAPEGAIDVRGERVADGDFGLEDALIDGRGKYSAEADLSAMKVVSSAINAGHHVQSMAEEVLAT